MLLLKSIHVVQELKDKIKEYIKVLNKKKNQIYDRKVKIVRNSLKSPSYINRIIIRKEGRKCSG